jgi:MinD-like ATPase involved in chromosome partitioning or flagellar assembly
LERTETGWSRPVEPTPRWRSLLDRALLGRSGEHSAVDYDDRQPAGYDDRGGPGYDDRPLDDQTDRYDSRYDGRYDERFDDAYGSRYDDRYADRPGIGYDDPRPDYDYDRATARAQVEVNGANYRPPLEFQSAQSSDGVDQQAAVLRADLGGPRVLAFANPKGGVHKTTATVLAAATAGSVRGRGVIAWDDNELRGTLGLRAGSARHARTIRHLLSDLTEIEMYSGYELTDRLDDYLRHASDGTYDVLAGEENPRFAQKLDPYTVRRVLELLCRTHDVICVDTGNNVESPNWRTVLQSADQLVVTTVPREDAAFTADWMLDLLEEAGLGEMVKNAVTLLSCPTPGKSPLLDDLAAHFGSRTRAVAVVPYDAQLENGSNIEYGMLHPVTKRAWLRAVAKMLEPYVR